MPGEKKSIYIFCWFKNVSFFSRACFVCLPEAAQAVDVMACMPCGVWRLLPPAAVQHQAGANPPYFMLYRCPVCWAEVTDTVKLFLVWCTWLQTRDDQPLAQWGCDTESNMCRFKFLGLDYFSKSPNCNLHLLVHKVFLNFRCEYEIKQKPSFRNIYWKTVAEVYPFERRHYSPSRSLATDGEQLVHGVLESANIVSRAKVILVSPV